MSTSPFPLKTNILSFSFSIVEGLREKESLSFEGRSLRFPFGSSTPPLVEEHQHAFLLFLDQVVRRCLFPLCSGSIRLSNEDSPPPGTLHSQACLSSLPLEGRLSSSSRPRLRTFDEGRSLLLVRAGRNRRPLNGSSRERFSPFPSLLGHSGHSWRRRPLTIIPDPGKGTIPSPFFAESNRLDSYSPWEGISQGSGIFLPSPLRGLDSGCGADLFFED